MDLGTEAFPGIGREDYVSGAVDYPAFAESSPVDGSKTLVSGLGRNFDRGIKGDYLVQIKARPATTR